MATDDRVIRVFISSTFRDMMQERDLLVKEVFPALRRICAKRFVTFTEVDLRWGITEERAAEGKVLPLCLAEIEKFGPEEAARRTQERKGKLAALKQQIRDSKLPLVEPYENPEALAKIIEKHFVDLIDQLYPEADLPDALHWERTAHEAHAKNKLFACINRPDHLTVLSIFAGVPEHDGRGLVVTGESGNGKTYLDKVVELTTILENNNDPRVEKGHRLLQELA